MLFFVGMTYCTRFIEDSQLSFEKMEKCVMRVCWPWCSYDHGCLSAPWSALPHPGFMQTWWPFLHLFSDTASEHPPGRLKAKQIDSPFFVFGFIPIRAASIRCVLPLPFPFFPLGLPSFKFFFWASRFLIRLLSFDSLLPFGASESESDALFFPFLSSF